MNNQRFGFTFNISKDKHYYFDTGTGKTSTCSPKEREFIDRILNNIISIETAFSENPESESFIKEERLFSDKQWPFLLPTKEKVAALVKGNCEQIVLELTESCNLRCKYCIYNEHHPNHRAFSPKKMNFVIAKRSIDNILSQFKGSRFALTFYGGEPLLKFDLMKKCIIYVRDNYKHISALSYGFTTNLTLLTDEMVDFLKTLNDIEIVCSLDGPRLYHDMFRTYESGRGSFDKAIRGFKLLLDKFYCVEAGRTLSINCVITPPYEKTKLITIKNFFYGELNIPKEISCNYSYVDMGNWDIDNYSQEGGDVLKISPLEEWAADDFVKNGTESEFFNLINIELYRIANRDISVDGFIDKSCLHGNCIPGQRRVYVTTDGDYKTCEKVGAAPSIGNCYKRYDIDRIFDLYIKGYADYFQELCNNCWARTLCGVCYESSMEGGVDCPYVSGELCETSKELLKDMFINYYRLYEHDKDKLDEAVRTINIM